MDDQYKDLSSRACKGDNDALHELFNLAQQYETDGNYQKSTEIFRDSAIAYRITASRNGTNAGSAESQVLWLEVKELIYQKWIEYNPDGLRELPYPASGITDEDIRHLVIDQLLKEDTYMDTFRFLEESLADAGMKFSSPGGSFQRRLCGVLGEVFGLCPLHCQYFQSSAVRVGLDIVAQIVMKRYKEDPHASHV